jgi:hypothetical protein
MIALCQMDEREFGEVYQKYAPKNAVAARRVNTIAGRLEAEFQRKRVSHGG